jgi:hypothetical protein
LANILTVLANWSTTEASNQPDSTDSATIAGDLRAIQAGVRYVYSQDTIASAATTDIGSKSAGSLTISGTTTITSLGTISAGIRKNVVFSGILILTYNATSLILPSNASITTAAGDTAEFESLGAGNWRCNWYQRDDGSALSFADASVTTAKLADLSVTTAKLAAGVVDGLTAVTIASGDYLAIADTSDSNNKKKALVSDITALGPRMTRRASSGTETLVAADMGKLIVTSTASTLTLPLISAVQDGEFIGFQLNGTAVVTVQKQSTDQLSWAGAAALDVVKLSQYGDHLILWADKTSSRWRVLSDGIAGPAFSVHRNGTNQTAIVTATYTKVQWTAEEYDYNGDFDSSTNYRFTPLIPGTYTFNCGTVWTAIGDQSDLQVALYKNGTLYKYMSNVSSGTNGQGTQFSGQAVANGSTDYFEIFVFQNSGVNRDLNGSATVTFWMGSRLK